MRDELIRAWARDLDLTHVVYVEKADRAASDEVFFYGSGWIGDRHLVAGKRRHFGARGDVPIVQTGGLHVRASLVRRNSSLFSRV